MEGMDPNAPRHTAATITAISLMISFLVVVFAGVASAVFVGNGWTEKMSTLMLATGSLLVSLNAQFLSRYLYDKPANWALFTKVGVMISLTLGGMVIILAAGVLVGQFVNPGLSVSALNVLIVIFAGMIGSLAGYLGFNKDKNV
jgi:hypothetical protein